MGQIKLINVKSLKRIINTPCSCGGEIQFCVEDLDKFMWVFFCKACAVELGKQIINELGQ